MNTDSGSLPSHEDVEDMRVTFSFINCAVQDS